MKYLQYTYAYLIFAAGILFVNLVAYLTLGTDFFAVQAEVTTNWFLVSVISSILLIPTYLLGVACILIGRHFAKIDFGPSGNSLFVWAFVSGVLLAFMPVLDFVVPGSIFGDLMDPFIITWLPIAITSIGYLAIKKYR